MGNINRFDYGLRWNTMMEAGGAVVGEDVGIVCNVELQKKV
jgi:polyisoprenoid-binding protein YceI